MHLSHINLHICILCTIDSAHYAIEVYVEHLHAWVVCLLHMGCAYLVDTYGVLTCTKEGMTCAALAACVMFMHDVMVLSCAC